MKKVLLTTLFAAIFWFLMFYEGIEFTSQIHNFFFWQAMSISTLTLIILTFAAQKDSLLRIFQVDRKFVLIGFLHGIALYIFSRVGVYLVTSVFPSTISDISNVYVTRLQQPDWLIVILLLIIIAPAEEIFWRGYLQDKLNIKFGKTKGLLISALIYTIIHIWAFNPMLLIAAFVLGIHWGLLYNRFNSVIPGIISHAIWDTLIFVILPVTF